MNKNTTGQDSGPTRMQAEFDLLADDALNDLPPAVYRRQYEAQCSTSGCSG